MSRFAVVALSVLLMVPRVSAGQPFTLRSADFHDGGAIPAVHEYSGCHGRNVVPTLSWSGAPAGTRSFALVVVDPDAPKAGGWHHWVVYNLAATRRSIGPTTLGGVTEGMTDFGVPGYGGPCPPLHDHVHHYVFTLYALDVPRLTGKALTYDGLVAAMDGHVVGATSLIGTFRRP